MSGQDMRSLALLAFPLIRRRIPSII